MSSFPFFTKRPIRRLVLVTGAVALLLGACGDDPAQPDSTTTSETPVDESADDAVIADLAAQLQSAEDLEEIEFTEDEARCAAEAVVDELGVERVQVAVLTEDEDADITDLADEEIAAIAGAMDACVDGIDTQLAAAVAVGILESADDTLPIDDAEAECVAAAVVDALGVERLLVVGAGAEGDDPFAGGAVTDEEGSAIADGFLGCVDISQVFLDQFRAEGVPEETANCLASEIDEESLRSLFAAEFTGQDVDPDALLGSALETCGVG